MPAAGKTSEQRTREATHYLNGSYIHRCEKMFSAVQTAKKAPGRSVAEEVANMLWRIFISNTNVVMK